MRGSAKEILPEVKETTRDALLHPANKEFAVKATFTIFDAMAKIGSAFWKHRIRGRSKKGTRIG